MTQVVKKKITKAVMTNWTKLYCITGEAKPTPTLSRPLGRMGVNTAEFCKLFNARTEAEGWKAGIKVPVRLYTYSDRTYKFEIRYPTIKQFMWDHKFKKKKQTFPAKKDKPIGVIDVREIYEIAKLKMQEANKHSETLESLCRKIAIHCERLNVKVVQFGGPKIEPKLDRMFEPQYNIWTLYDENKSLWEDKNVKSDEVYRWQNP